MSSEMGSDHSSQVEAEVNHLVDLHLQASNTYLSLSFSFDLHDLVPRGTGRFFRQLAEQKRRGAELLLQVRKLRGRALVQDGLTWAQDDCGQPSDAMEVALAQEKALNQALLDLNALGAAHQDHQLCGFLEEHFLGREVKLIKKMGRYLKTFRRLAGSQTQRQECLLWDLILNND